MTRIAAAEDWVIPSSIPLENLRSRDLEECVYWLLDSMGAQDIEWRVGGSGDGTADGGRDLEAKLLTPNSDGELEPRTWWLECKGRKGTVEPRAVRDAATNALAFDHVHALVVVTNSTFSNPTKDWVARWNLAHARPKLELWDAMHLERLLARQPSVVLRLFSAALSPEGKREAVRARLWNRLEYAPTSVLEQLWVDRESINIDPMSRFALIASEIANRSIGLRPWAAIASVGEQLDTLQVVLINVRYLVDRIHKAGAGQGPLFRSINYLVLACLQHTSAAELSTMFQFWVTTYNGVLLPEALIDFYVGPILNNLQGELTDLCVTDCARVSRLSAPTNTEDGENVDTYWNRFDAETLTHKADDRVFWLENKRASCRVGFRVDEENDCPLIHAENDIGSLPKLLNIAQHISRARIAIVKEERSKVIR